MGNIDKYITFEPVSQEDDFNMCLDKIIGKVQLLEVPGQNGFNKLIEDGKVKSIELFPYGLGEKDEKGNIKSFDLLGFSVKYNFKKEEKDGTND